MQNGNQYNFLKLKLPLILQNVQALLKKINNHFSELLKSLNFFLFSLIYAIQLIILWFDKKQNKLSFLKKQNLNQFFWKIKTLLRKS